MDGGLPFILAFIARFEEDHRDGALLGQRVGDHLPVAGFKDVQREQRVWEEDGVGQWEDGQLLKV